MTNEKEFKDSLLAFSITEKFNFNKRLGELYEQNNKYDQAANYFELAYMSLKSN